MERDYLELLELQQIIRDGVEEAVPGIVRVRAEVASVQQKTNGHCYLELCQSDERVQLAKIRAVIWRSRAVSLLKEFAKENGAPLQPGMALVFEGRVNYSEIYGVTLIVEGIDFSTTMGEAELRRRRTIEKLEMEGLLELQKELALPSVPYCLAVISAPDAAGFGDFRRHLLENEYGFAFDVTLFEATMQGESAPESIIAALRECVAGPATAATPDAILILRGGGSVLDLACFDDYELCAAIARCPVPVFTAIGHDRDEHAADLVANSAVKTPTALADLFIDAVAAEDEQITSYASRLKLAFTSKLAAQTAFTDKLQHRIVFALNHVLTAADARISKLETRITAADPRLLLKRGYTLITNDKGKFIKRAADANPGDAIRVLYPDGTLNCTVNGKV